MTQAQKPHSDPEVMGRFRRFLVRADVPVFVEALDGLVEQKEAADRRDDWLAKQLDGILEDAEALFRAIGSGSGQSGGEAQSARALLANLRDARAALNPASAPVDGHPCKGQGAEYLVEQSNSNPAKRLS